MADVKLIMVTAAFIIIFIIVLAVITFYTGIRPQKFVSDASPSDFRLKYENLSLKTEDGVLLDAWWIPSKNKTRKTIIVLHGYPFDKGNVLAVSRFLQKDFNLLLFDFRYLGRSSGGYTSIGYHEQKDLKAAAEYLREKNQTKIGVFGFSMGGAVGLMGAKQSKVDTVVADSSYASLNNMLAETYRIFSVFKIPFVWTTKVLSRAILNIDVADVSPEESIKHLQIPVLIIHSSGDEQVSVRNAYQLQSANPAAELWIIDKAKHGYTASVAGRQYEERILKFFKDNLS